MDTTADKQRSNAEQLRGLVRSLSLSSRFSFYLVACETPAVADTVFAHLEREVPASRGAETRLVRLDPYRISAPLEESIPRELLTTEVLERLVYPSDEEIAASAIHVIDASRALPVDEDAWKWLFNRMNEQRNIIIQRIRRELIVFVPRWLVNTFRMHAADLYSLCSGDFRILAEPREAVDDPVPWSWEPMNAEQPSRRLVIELDTAPDERLTTPTDGYWPNLVRALILSGDIELSACRSSAALRAYEAALETTRRFTSDAHSAKRNTDAWTESHVLAEWRQLLSVSVARTGDARFFSGQMEDAARSYDEALSIINSLHDAVRSSPTWLRNLSTIAVKRGDVHQSLNRLDDAITSYLVALGIRRGLFREAEPSWRDRDIVTSLQRLGNAHARRGDHARSLRAYEEAITTMRERSSLIVYGPYRLDLISLLERHGSLLLKGGELDQAREDFMMAAELTQGSLDGAETSAAWRKGQRRVLQRLHDVLVSTGAHKHLHVVDQALRKATDSSPPPG